MGVAPRAAGSKIKKTLWSNPSKSSSFSGKKITISGISKCDQIYVSYAGYANETFTFCVVVDVKSFINSASKVNYIVQLGAPLKESITDVRVRKMFINNIESDIIEFGNAGRYDDGAWANTNMVCVPYEIYTYA